MPLRIRMQDFRGQHKRASVTIISADQYCRIARQLTNKTRTERQLLQHLLALPLNTIAADNSQSTVLALPYGRNTNESVLFWLEK